MDLVTRFAAVLAGSALVVSLTFGAAAPAAAATNLTVGTTGRTSNDWPLYVAQKMGIFAANGLAVEIVDAGSPVGATQQLVGGSIDLGSVTSTELAQAIQKDVPIVSVSQNVNRPPYLVLGRKGMKSVSQLKGKTVIVSSPNAITRVFMDTVLSKNGLKPDDVTYTYAGATNQRFAALLSGAVDASILLPPFSFRAISQGYPVIADVLNYYPYFVFDTYCANTAWAAKNHASLVAFLKSIIAATNYLYDTRNRDNNIKILSDATGTSSDDATKSYDQLVTKIHSFALNKTSTPEDYNKVIDVLKALKLTKEPLPPVTKYYDNTYANEALTQLHMKH